MRDGTTSLLRTLATTVALACGALLGGAASAQGTIAWIEVEGSPKERPDPLAFLAGPDAEPTMLDLLAGLERAAESRRISGVVLRLREPALTMTQVEELGSAVQRVRAAGKPVHLFTENYGPAELALATYADEAIAQPGGAVSLPGLYMEEMFLADTLSLAGVAMHYVQVGDYKGASETLGRAAPSPEWSENINALLDGLYGAMRARFTSGRGMSEEDLTEAMREAWWATPERAVELGLIDSVVDRMDVDAHLEGRYGPFEVATDLAAPRGAEMDLTNPFGMLDALMSDKASEPTRDTVAVLHIRGVIVDGESETGGPLGGEQVGALTIREALAELETNPLVRGVIVRIDSPGGSATASESIWLGVRRVAAVKPVWVSVGGMAASGGYYVLSAGDHVLVNPSSIVGSIGVVGGKAALGGLFEKLKATVVPRARGPRADLLGRVAPWTAEQEALVRSRMEETYRLFCDRVREGRPDADLEKVAEGRLFAGVDAVRLGMADALGGLDDAVEGLAEQEGLSPGTYDVLHFPKAPTLAEAISQAMERFGLGADAPGVGAAALLREAVGPRAWPAIRDAAEALLLVREEPVLLASPRVLVQP